MKTCGSILSSLLIFFVVVVHARKSIDALENDRSRRLAVVGSETSDANVLCDWYSTMPASTNKAKLTNWCGAKTTTGSYVNGPCTGTGGAWLGVACAVFGGGDRVTVLDTCQNRGSGCTGVTGLGGSLPNSIWGLNALTKVDIGVNSLSGTIPSSMGGLTGLTSLSLSLNSLSGSIPPSLGGLTQLTGLYLFTNALTGPVPPTFCSLKPSIDLQIQSNPGLTCYPSCLAANANFLASGKGSLSAVCPSPPLIYLPFDGSAINLVTGSAATVVGSLTYAASSFGQAAFFNNVITNFPANYVLVPNSAGWAPLSVSFWFKTDQIAIYQTVVSLCSSTQPQSGSDTEFIQIDIEQNKILVAVAMPVPWTFLIRSSALIAPNVWQKVVVTISASFVVSLYINGLPVGSQTGTSAPAASRYFQWLIGGSSDGLRSFRGSVDEFKVFNYILSLDSIQADIPVKGSESSDANVLCDFYNTVPAANRAKLANWCGAGDKSSVCGAAGTSSWLGVACAVVGGVRRVTSLNTFNGGVREFGGSLPASIGGLDALTLMCLAVSIISGSIPSSLGSLTGLTSLDLNNNRITGIIPPSLGALTGLTYFHPGGNLLSGSIPSSLGALIKLGYLDLGHNRLSGSIPSSLGALTNLGLLAIYNNRLTGSIPSSLGTLTGLTYLILHTNALTGPMPLSLCSLKPIIHLQVQSNPGLTCYPSCLAADPNFKKDASLYSCGDEQILCAFYNTMPSTGKAKLTNWCGAGDASRVCGAAGTSSWLGVTCAVVGGVSRVTKLDTCQYTGSVCVVTGLGGSLPTSIGGLDALTRLDLAYVGLTGSIPSSLGALTGLTYIDLTSSFFSGSIPSSLGALTGLITAGLSSSSLSGSIPSSLGGLTGLTALNLGSNRLSGTIPSTFGSLSHLAWFSLMVNALTGPVPSSFCSLKTSIHLLVQSNPGLTCYPSCLSPFTAVIKDVSLPSCDQQIVCDLYNTMPATGKAKLTNWCGAGDKSSVCGAAGTSSWLGVTCAVVGGVSRVTSLDTHTPGVKGLGGSLPPSIGGLDALTSLIFFYAGLSGTVPTSIGALTGLTGIGLGANSFSGTIPSSVGALTGLTGFNFNVNSFSGTVPASLGGLTRLTTLALEHNLLSGSIPSSLGGFIGLTWLSLSVNSFTGSIPSSLGGLTRLLAHLYLHQNALTGTVPPTFCSLKPSIDLNIKTNPGLTCYPPCLAADPNFQKDASLYSCGDEQIVCAFYNTMPATGNRAKLTNWCGAGDKSSVCGAAGTSSWLGVACAVVGGVSRVTKLDTCMLTGSGCAGVTGLGGSLPTSIGGLDALTKIAFTYASLTGSIPSSLGGLTGLTFLGLAANYLSGTIPLTMGALTRLTWLDLGFNSLSGTIPATLDALTGLTTVGFNHNSLSGSIPSLLGTLTKLTGLYLENNAALSGPVPASFCSLKPSITLHIQSNPGLACYPYCLYSYTSITKDASLLACPVPLPQSYLPTSALPAGRTLVANTLLGDVALPAGYVLSFDVMPTADGSALRSLLHLTATGGDTGAGARLPAVYFCASGTAGCPTLGVTAVYSGLVAASAVVWPVAVPLNAWSTVTVTVNTLELSLTLAVSGGGAAAAQSAVLALGVPTTWANAQVWMADPWAAAASAGGRNLQITERGSEQGDATVLCDFYNTMPAAGQAKLTNWCGAKTTTGSYINGPCTGTAGAWLGVTCAVVGSVRRVTKLDTCQWTGSACALVAGIGGSLPASIGGLDALTSLDLLKAGIWGSIPSSLGGLTGLNILQLRSNSLSGSIPSSLADLSRLTILSFSTNSLSGTIPLSLGALTGLVALSFDANSFSGSIPSSLGALTRLTQLGFQVNALSGSIPSSLGALTKLNILTINTNSLSGNIPSFLGALTALTLLYLHQNALTGPVPASFCSLKPIIDLQVQGNPGLTCYPPCLVADPNFQKDASLYSCGDEQIVCAFYNTMPATGKAKLTNWCGAGDKSSVCGAAGTSSWLGVACAVVGGASRVTNLSMCHSTGSVCVVTGLGGSLPTSIGGLDALTYLDLARAGLSGTIPPSVEALTGLTFLNFFGNALSGSIPSFLGALPRLTLLGLASNSFSGGIPSSLGGLTGLTHINLGFNFLSGTIPSFIGNFKGLLHLGLNTNSFSGSIPSSLGGLTQLTDLFLFTNTLTGPVPPTFCSLKPIIHLQVQSNPGLTCFPSCLAADPNFKKDASLYSCGDEQILCAFYNTMPASVNRAKLTNWCGAGDKSSVCGAAGTSSWLGVGCAVVGGASRVTRLDTPNAGVTGLGGSLPTSIGALNALTFLDLNSFGLTSSLPSSIGTLTALNLLKLDGNHFSGSIPSSLVGLTGLTSLSLAEKTFSGSIPSFLGALTGLTGLFLQGAFFSGSIPPSLGALTKLNYLWLNGNTLTGPVPASFCSLPSSINLRVNINPGLTCYPFCLFASMSFTRDPACLICTTPLPLSFYPTTTGTPLTANKLLGTIALPAGYLISFDLMPSSLTSTSNDTALRSVLHLTASGDDAGPGARLPAVYMCGSRTVGCASPLALSVIYMGGATSATLNTPAGLPLNAWSTVTVAVNTVANSMTLAVAGSAPTQAVLQVPIATVWPNVLVLGADSWAAVASGVSIRKLVIAERGSEQGDATVLCEFWATATAAGQAKLTNWCGAKTATGSFVNGPCSTGSSAWSGVACSSVEGASRVTSISLNGLATSGGSSLPPSIAGLDALVSLSLVSTLRGQSIPSQLGSLLHLTSLNLAGNALVGPISTALGLLTSLTSLSLYSNSLTGTLPNFLGGLSDLTSLQLGQNKLHGVIPPVIAGLPLLTALGLQANSFTGPLSDAFCSLARSVQLQLQGNKGLTCYPQCLAFVPGLQKDVTFRACGDEQALCAYYSSLQPLSQAKLKNWCGPVFACAGFFGSPQNVSATWTGVKCEVASLTDTSYLRVSALDLNSRSLGGSLPSLFGQLTFLSSLLMRDNQIVGTLPGELGLLTKLVSINFELNNLASTLPSELGRLSSLAFLGLGFNKLTSALPSLLGGLSQLTYLTLNNNFLRGNLTSPGQNVMGSLKKLAVLSLGENSLTGSIPSLLFAQVTKLTSLSLQENQLTGSLPSTMGLLTRLTALSLQKNQLVGIIPATFCDFMPEIIIQLQLNPDLRCYPQCMATFSAFTRDPQCKSCFISFAPTAQPSPEPTTAMPTPLPSGMPSPKPTSRPTPLPSAVPSPQPTQQPTPRPSAHPTPRPSARPSPVPTAVPTQFPSYLNGTVVTKVATGTTGYDIPDVVFTNLNGRFNMYWFLTVTVAATGGHGGSQPALTFKYSGGPKSAASPITLNNKCTLEDHCPADSVPLSVNSTQTYCVTNWQFTPEDFNPARGGSLRFTATTRGFIGTVCTLKDSGIYITYIMSSYNPIPTSEPTPRPTLTPTPRVIDLSPTALPTLAPSAVPSASPTAPSPNPTMHPTYTTSKKLVKTVGSSVNQNGAYSVPRVNFTNLNAESATKASYGWFLNVDIAGTGWGSDARFQNAVVQMSFAAPSASASSNRRLDGSPNQILLTQTCNPGNTCDDPRGPQLFRCVTNYFIDPTLLKTIDGGAIYLDAYTQGVLTTQCQYKIDSSRFRFFVTYTLTASNAEPTPMPTLIPTTALPTPVPSYNLKIATTGGLANPVLAQGAPLWAVGAGAGIFAMLAMVLYPLRFHKKDDKHAIADGEIVHLSLHSIVISTALSGSAFISECFLIKILFSQADLGDVAGLAVMGRITHLVAGALLVYLCNKSPKRRVFKRVRPLKALLNMTVYTHNLNIMGVLFLFSLCEVTLLRFLPWLNSKFASELGGYPSPFVFYVCVYSKLVQSLFTISAQSLLLRKLLETSTGMPPTLLFLCVNMSITLLNFLINALEAVLRSTLVKHWTTADEEKADKLSGKVHSSRRRSSAPNTAESNPMHSNAIVDFASFYPAAETDMGYVRRQSLTLEDVRSAAPGGERGSFYGDMGTGISLPPLRRSSLNAANASLPVPGLGPAPARPVSRRGSTRRDSIPASPVVSSAAFVAPGAQPAGPYQLNLARLPVHVETKQAEEGGNFLE